MAHTFALQRVQPSGDLFLLEYDEQDAIFAAIPNGNLSNAELRELLDEIDAGETPSLESEWQQNAEWAREQRWGFPLTRDDLSLD